MRKIIVAKMVHTKWGLFAKFNDDLIAFEFPPNANWKDFELDVEQEFEVFYTLTFAKFPNKSNKEWETIEADTLEELEKKYEFNEFNLSLSNVYPMVSLKKPSLE